MANINGTNNADVLDDADGVTNLSDTINGFGGNDLIFGLGGNDLVFGGAGDDDIYGGSGDDKLVGGAGNDELFAGVGEDTASYAGASAGVTVNLIAGTATGGDGNDSLSGIENLIGSDHADSLHGDAFENRIEGGLGRDVISGGGGFDFLFAGDDNDSVDGGEQGDFVDGGGGDDTVDGALGDDIVIGGMGNDRVFGGMGTDVLKGFAGADQLDGGDGFDAADYDESTAGVFISLLAGTASGGHAEGDTLVAIEAVYGTSFADKVTGSDGANELVGREGDDNLKGLAGDDIISGGDGNDGLDGGMGGDAMVGGNGDDTYVVDNANDIVDEEGTDGADVVLTTVSFSFIDALHVKGEFETLTLRGKADIDGTGNGLDNLINGNAGANRLDGGAGEDILRGRGGNDSYVVDDTGDVVDEGSDGSSGIDHVFARISFSLSNTLHVKGAIENLTLIGTTGIDATGNNLANVIVGNSGSNVIRGLGGNDRLTGGAGADNFVFDAALNKKTNVDRITDFTTDDTIVLDQAVFGKLKLGELKLKAFHEGRKAHDGNDRIIYNENSGKLIYDQNGDNRGGATVFAKLTKGLDLSEADFLVI